MMHLKPNKKYLLKLSNVGFLYKHSNFNSITNHAEFIHESLKKANNYRKNKS